MPWLMFLACRAFGVNGRSARRWMWLLPSGYCFALQSSGPQNDGYAVNYVLAALALAAFAFHSRHRASFWLALLAVALLTGAKLSNLPLLLPLGLALWPVLFRVRWLNWRLAPVLALAGICSFLPLAGLCWLHTGDWTGDPADQWQMRPVNSTGAVAANLMEFANDAVHPPVLPGCERGNVLLEPLNRSAFIHWLERVQPNFTGVKFGEIAYEGGVGLGCGVGLYALFLLLGSGFVKPIAKVFRATDLPLAWRPSPCCWPNSAPATPRARSSRSPGSRPWLTVRRG